MSNLLKELFIALWVEFHKACRSRALWVSALVFAFITIICGLFMFILKDPEKAQSLGLLGAKAQIFGGTADWTSFISLMLIMVSIGGLVIFGLIFIWIFGREFSDKTVYDMLSLPTLRITIVTAKIITAAYWSLALVALSFLFMLGIGTTLQLPGWSVTMILDGLYTMLVTSCMTIILCIPFGLVASITRGYLPAVGCIFLIILLDQIVDQLGYGSYFPWDVPALYSGAAEVLTGAATTQLGLISYILVGIVGFISIAVTGVWWLHADQT